MKYVQLYAKIADVIYDKISSEYFDDVYESLFGDFDEDKCVEEESLEMAEEESLEMAEEKMYQDTFLNLYGLIVAHDFEKLLFKGLSDHPIFGIKQGKYVRVTTDPPPLTVEGFIAQINTRDIRPDSTEYVHDRVKSLFNVSPEGHTPGYYLIDPKDPSNFKQFNNLNAIIRHILPAEYF